MNFEECFKHDLAFSKEKPPTCGMCMNDKQVCKMELGLCVVRFWCLKNGGWKPGTALGVKLQAGSGCDPPVQAAWRLPLLPRKKQVPVIFWVLWTVSKLQSVWSWANHRDAQQCPMGGFAGCHQVSPIPGAKDWFPLAMCGLHCMGEHQGGDYPVLVLDRTQTKPEAAGAKLGTLFF